MSEVVVVLLRTPKFVWQKNLTLASKSAVCATGETFDFSLWSLNDLRKHCALVQLVMRKDVRHLQQTWFRFLLRCADQVGESLKTLRPFFVHTGDARAVRRIKHLLGQLTDEETSQFVVSFKKWTDCAQRVADRFFLLPAAEKSTPTLATIVEEKDIE